MDENPTQAFLLPVWTSALRDGLGFDVREYPIEGSAKQTIGWCVVRRAGRFGVRVGNRPFATLFNVVWKSNVTESERERGICSLARRERFLWLDLREVVADAPHDGDNGLIPNYRHDLQTPGRWQSYSRIVRRSVRKAKQEGVSVITKHAPELLFKLLETARRRRGHRPFSFGLDQFGRFSDILNESKQVEMFFSLSPKAVALAGHMCFRSAGNVYDILSARDDRTASRFDNYLLVHTMLDHYERLGCAVFDHCGANIPAVAEFKRRFSPKQVFLKRRACGVLAWLIERR